MISSAFPELVGGDLGWQLLQLACALEWNRMEVRRSDTPVDFIEYFAGDAALTHEHLRVGVDGCGGSFGQPSGGFWRVRVACVFLCLGWRGDALVAARRQTEV